MSHQLQKSKFHFIGIGGIGMCGLAELLHNMGAQVAGSDLSENANTEHLKKIGVDVKKGHHAEHLKNVDVVVYSSAVHADNPEMVEAKKKKIPVIPRAEALAEIMRLKRGIAVAGTHGKTTTTSLVAAIFLQAQLNPTIVVGGRLDLIQSTALLGSGDWLIAEADESDGSFNKLSPEISIITNIDNDHLDYYKNFENLQKAFVAFAAKVPFYGCSIVCGDDPEVRKIFQNFHKKVHFYGFNQSNEFFVQGENGTYEVWQNLDSHKKKLGTFQINVPGKHNALNATAALLSGMQAGLTFEQCAKGLLSFQGVDRRFHFKGEKNQIKIYDDYGHHPTEIAATLQAFKEKFPKQRIVVLFQPHRYSRTQICWNDFLTCFKDCDVLYMTDIYPAGEKAIPGIDSKKLTEEIKHPNRQHIEKNESMYSQIKKDLKPGDVFITLGAGDLWKTGMKILESL